MTETEIVKLIEQIENDKPVAREDFRHVELLGKLAPHFFHETVDSGRNPLNAFCQGCSLRIEFE